MVKRLVSFGCSFTKGMDLDDPNSAYPALIANHLGLEYLCKAEHGSSNETILRTLTEHLREPLQADHILIGWTAKHRREYILGDAHHVFHVGNPHGNPDAQIQATHDHIMGHASKRIIHQDFIDLVDQTHWILSHFGLPYTMVNCLQDVKSSHILEIPDMRSFSHLYAVSSTGHPLEDAHLDYAELILRNM